MKSVSDAGNQNQHLTVGYLIRFSFPLTLTFLMMAGSAPLVSIGITVMHDADGERVHLFAFLLTFTTSLLVYSPMFIARNVAICTVTDRRSIFRYANFFVVCASVSSIILILISKVDAVGDLLFVSLLDIDPVVARLARQGIIIFTPVPIFVALRGLAHSCHINNGQTWYVGTGTGIRLGCMTIFVFGYAIHADLSGPILGGLTFMVGIGIETVFVLAMLWNKRQWTTVGEQRLLGYGEYLRYAGPLMFASMLSQLLGPALIYLISQCRQPVENGGAFNLVRDTAWVTFSILMSVQPVVVTCATSERNFKILFRFAAFMTLAITGIIMLVALTPLRELIFVRCLKVDNTIILRLTFLSLLWLIIHPVINMANLFVAALHTRSGRTIWVTLGNLAGFAVLAILVFCFDLPTWEGAILAVIASALFNLAIAVVQALGLLKGGLRAVLSPVSMAEKFDRTNSTKTTEIMDDQTGPELL